MQHNTSSIVMRFYRNTLAWCSDWLNHQSIITPADVMAYLCRVLDDDNRID